MRGLRLGFLGAVVLLVWSTTAQAGWEYVCWYTYSEQACSYYVQGHQEYDEYTGAMIWVPEGWYSTVQPVWTPSCQWSYTYDPLPPPGGFEPPPDYSGSGVSMWVTGIDASNPQSVNASISWYSADGCDLSAIRMFVGWWDHETLAGPIPGSVTMGHVNLADPGNMRLQFDAYDCYGDFTTSASTFITRDPRSKDAVTSVVFTYFDTAPIGNGVEYIVPVANQYTRTFHQEYVQTSFDVPAVNSGGVRYELKSAMDAIGFGPIQFLPGYPNYSDIWSAAGVGYGTASENMNSLGYQSFDGTIAYGRPEISGPLFGFEPQVAATIPNFQWMMTSGMAKCDIVNASSTMSIDPF